MHLTNFRTDDDYDSTVVPIAGYHCQQCGSTDADDLGDDTYSRCCNEIVVDACETGVCNHHEGNLRYPEPVVYGPRFTSTHPYKPGDRVRFGTAGASFMTNGKVLSVYRGGSPESFWYYIDVDGGRGAVNVGQGWVYDPEPTP